MEEHDLDLYWHALNYRGALLPAESEIHWQALEACVARLVAQEREACAKVCESEHVGKSVADECDNDGDCAYNMALRDAAAAIRERGNQEIQG